MADDDTGSKGSASDDLAKLIRKRGTIRSTITKLSKVKDEELVADVVDDKIARLIALDEKIEELYDADESLTEEQLAKEEDAVEHYRELYLTLKSRVSEGVVKDKSFSVKKKEDEDLEEDDRPEKRREKRDSFKKRTKLPKFDLPSFDGSIEKWIDFWSQFEQIDEDKDSTDQEKMRYLKQSVTGKAKEYLDGWPTCAKNYEKAKAGLKRRFGKDGKLIDFYIRELIDLVAKRLRQGELDILEFYDKLTTCVNNLESLGLTAQKHSVIIVPLIERSLPVRILREWEKEKRGRGKPFKRVENLLDFDDSVEDEEEIDQLTFLMEFLDRLADTESTVTDTRGGNNRSRSGRNSRVENPPRTDNPARSDNFMRNDSAVATGNDLLNNNSNSFNRNKTKKFKDKNPSDTTESCIFCGASAASHASQDCGYALKFNVTERRDIVKNKKACFRCLKTTHMSANCDASVWCPICKRKHYEFVCPERVEQPTGDRQRAEPSKSTDVKPVPAKNEYKPKDKRGGGGNSDELVKKAFNGFVSGNVERVILQTLCVKIYLPSGGTKIVRCMCDPGSSFSYIVVRTAEGLRLTKIGTKFVEHGLFGGINTGPIKHTEYKVRVSSVTGGEIMEVRLLDQEEICGEIPRISDPRILEHLRQMGVHLSDVGSETDEIEMMLGADYFAPLLTGEIRKYENLTALETVLGWTVMGKIGLRGQSNLCYAPGLMNYSFWDLEVLGIANKELGKKSDDALLTRFENEVRVLDDGRYEVKLPFQESVPEIESNFFLAERRLKTVAKKLTRADRFDEYDRIFKEWESEGIIEEVSGDSSGHFLPHRPVYKESSATTKTRPVFDASQKDSKHVSLNDCLEKGPNLIELIPKILFDFRFKKIGLVADIRKAFLQIAVHADDRKFLQFLWLDDQGKTKVYQHKRVVFGLTCSPFLLNATIAYHLNLLASVYPETVNKLRGAFYADNLVTSVDTMEQSQTFQEKACEVMNKGKFELREWAFTGQEISGDSGPHVMVLGLRWDTISDTLTCQIKWAPLMNDVKITKRQVLSIIQSIFDPIGFVSPILVLPKCIFRETWSRKLTWDEDLPEDLTKQFIKWQHEIMKLEDCKFPRWAMLENCTDVSLHVFVDGSKLAYATCIFLRSENAEQVKLHLVLAKTRITPLKDNELTIPRIELMAATIGARLYDSLVVNEFIKNIRVTFWSDSMVVLSWIRENRKYQPFVKNRVTEILKLTKDVKRWRHVPGDMNPADLLSRGCGGKRLAAEQWWLGPNWLCDGESDWPQEEPAIVDINLVALEVRESSSLIDQLKLCENYTDAVRMVAYVKRFFSTRCNDAADKLTVEEMQSAEITLFRLIQREAFADRKPEKTKGKDEKFRRLSVVEDRDGLLRVTSRLTLLASDENYVYPILLPGQHAIVQMMIMDVHRKTKHAGVLTTMVTLRKDFWIMKSRIAVKKALRTCIKCQRFSAKSVIPPAAPLPIERVQASQAFENVGVDCAGPLYTYGERKLYVLIFTCSVFRAVHLEVLENMDTDSFILGLRRFIARRGRMARVISDNGTNFVGTVNRLQELDWDKINEFSRLEKINWKFNPPSAPWWGGFYERLIGVVKGLLRKNLGRTLLGYEQLVTLVTECEAIVNARPLTYLAEDDEVVPLTPALLLNNIHNISVEDLDEIDRTNLVSSIRRAQKIREAIKERFQKEYISLLMEQARRTRRTLRVNDYVLVQDDRLKRLHWPIGKVVELRAGADGQERVAKVLVQGKVKVRPYQRLFPLEMPSDKEGNLRSDSESDQRLDEEVSQIDTRGHSESDDEGSQSTDEEWNGREDERESRHSSGESTDHSVSPLPVRQTRRGREVKLPARYR